MPNWTYQAVTITGSKESIDKIDELDMDFDKIIPMPKDLMLADTSHPSKTLENQYKSNIKKYGYRSWYEWCIAKWGTKWKAIKLDNVKFKRRESDSQITFVYWTAWSLPTGIFEKLVKTFKDIKIKIDCIEEGGFFFGTLYLDKSGWDEELFYNDSKGVNYEEMFAQWETKYCKGKDNREVKQK